MTHLEGAINHANDVVELLMVQYGAVLLNMKTELVCETLASRFTLERAESSWQRLPEGGREKYYRVFTRRVTFTQTWRLFSRTLKNAVSVLTMIKRSP